MIYLLAANSRKAARLIAGSSKEEGARSRDRQAIVTAPFEGHGAGFSTLLNQRPLEQATRP